MKMKILACAVVTQLSSGASFADALGYSYSVIAKDESLQFSSINKSGVAIGKSTATNQVALFKNGVVTLGLAKPAGVTYTNLVSGVAINDAGNGVGELDVLPTDFDGLFTASWTVVWDAANNYAPVALPWSKRSGAKAISKGNIVAGEFINQSNDGKQETKIRGLYVSTFSNGALSDPVTAGNKAYGHVSGVNDSGVVVGFCIGWTSSPCTKNGGYISNKALDAAGKLDLSLALRTFTDLGSLGGGYTYPRAINNSGQVVGESSTAAGVTHAFLYSGGVLKDLGTLGGSNSYAYGINEAGAVVGVSETASGERRAFIYVGGQMYDLAGAASSAAAISTDGRIVGSRAFVDASTGDTKYYPVIWTK
jgi:probable HAF family extracellular repeat protein